MEDILGIYWNYIDEILCFAAIISILLFSTFGARLRRARNRDAPPGQPPRTVAIVSIAIVLAYVLLGLLYLFSRSYSDYGEPVIPLLAENARHGLPIYSPIGSPHSVTGSNYGPICFLLELPALFSGLGLWSTKLLGIIASVGGAAISFWVFARRVGLTIALYVEAIVLALLLSQQHLYPLWDRPDSFLIFNTALAIALCEISNPYIALLGIAALAGFDSGLKIFGFIYLSPLAFIAASRCRSVASLAITVFAGAVVFAAIVYLPFVLPSFSLKDYLDNLFLMRGQGVSTWLIIKSLSFEVSLLGVLIAPLLIRRGWVDIGAIVTLGVASSLVAVVAGKPGGGPAYLMPFIPISAYLAVRAISAPSNDAAVTRREAMPAFALLLLAFALVVAPNLAYLEYRRIVDITRVHIDVSKENELRSIFIRYPDAEMGHGGTFKNPDEYYRVEKAFLGQAVRFDYVNFADQRAAGMSSAPLAAMFASCAIPRWVFARNAPPFSGTMGYFDKPLLGEAALAAFNQHYALEALYPRYGVWACRAKTVTVAHG